MKFGESAHFPAKAARLHREIDVVAQVDALAEQNARGCGGDAALLGRRQRADCPALPRLEHLRRGFRQQEDVAMRHRQHGDGLLRHTKGPQRFQYLRPRSAQDEQRREGDRGLHPRR